MGFLEAVAIFAAGMAAGTINTVVGSGTLITFPVLLAFGYAPVVANVSNTVGLVPGSAAGAVGYRRELSGQRRRVLWLACASLSGGVIGAWDFFAPAMLAEARRRSFSFRTTNTRVEKAKLGGEAGLFGAAYLPWAK